MLADGARVALGYRRDRVRAQQVAESLAPLGSVQLVQADIADPQAAQDALRTIEQALGPVDILVHAAGHTTFGLLQELSDTDWQALLGVHLSAAFYLARATLPHMIRQRHGRIVFISSIDSLRGAAGEAAYSAAKAGLNGLTRALAKETARSGVTVHAIAAGAIDTPMLSYLSTADRAALADDYPLGHIGQPMDVARLVGFLVDDQDGFWTGQVHTLAGGLDL